MLELQIQIDAIAACILDCLGDEASDFAEPSDLTPDLRLVLDLGFDDPEITTLVVELEDCYGRDLFLRIGSDTTISDLCEQIGGSVRH